MSIARAQGRVPSLDGIRGAAVLLVTMFHFLAIPDPSRGIRAIPFKIAYFGWTGVDLFFVLSGFLITSILWSSKEGPHYFRNFYMRRVLRIFPLYYGVLIVSLLVVPAIDHLRTPAVAGVLHRQWMFWLYVSNFSVRPINGDWLNLGHFWSLAIEEQFYLLWPAVIFFSSRKVAIRVAIGAALTSIALRAGALLMVISRPEIASSVKAAAFSWTPFRLDALATGALIALWSLEASSRRKLEIAARTGGVAALAIVAWLIWTNGVNRVFSTPQNIPAAVQAALTYSVVAIAFGAIVVEAGRPLSAIARLFAFRPLRVLGKYSYGIYVFQGLLAPSFALLFADLAARARTSDAAAWAYFLLCTTIVTLISIVSWHVYEQRFLRLKAIFPRDETVSLTT